MNGIAVLVTLAAVGVDYGWQPSSDGQLEYIIQIEPGLLDSLKNGAEIASVIHPDAQGVRKFRIKVGTGTVPRTGRLQSSTAPTALSTSSVAGSPAGNSGIGSTYGSPGNSNNTAGGGAGSIPAATSGTRRGIDFGADGFLILPPPPPLGMDGKASVLVRPGSGTAAVSGTINQPSVGPLPTLDRIQPPASADVNLGAPTGGGFPLTPNTGPSISAPTNNWGSRDNDPPSPPIEFQPAKPVRSPSNEFGSPAPILGAGRSEVLPPGASDPTSHVAAEDRTDAGQSPKKDLLASVADRGAAAQKPTLDEKSAEELKEMERQMEPAKPWRTLVLTSLALFASLAANVYLGWVALGIYRRYREVAAQLHRFQASLT